LESYSPELCIIKLFVKDKEAYDTYFNQIKNMNFDIEIKVLLKTIESYYKKYESHVYIGEEELSTFYKVINPIDKNKEIILSIINTVYNIEVSDSIIKDLIRNMIEKEISLSIIDKLTPVISENKYGILSSITDELARFDSLIEQQDESSLFVVPDLAQLLEEKKTHGILKWRMHCLQEALGNIEGSVLGHIQARPECFTPDTEVLTPTGWKRFDAISYDDKLACVNEYRELKFEKPSHIECHEESDMYFIHDIVGRVSLKVSAKHNMIYENNKGDLVKQQAKDIKYDCNKKHHTAGYGSGTKVFTAFDALQIAYQADGASRSYKEYGYSFSFKKERKIKRLESILQELNYSYTKYKNGNKGQTGFYVKTTQPLYKHFNWINLEEVSTTYAREFIEELSYWDCTRRTNKRFKFDTTNKAVADIVHAITSLANYNCCYSHFIDNRKETFKDIYSLSIRTNYQPSRGASIIKEPLVYSGNVYCVTVSTGMILVRHNNCISICGNTGKTSLLASETTWIARQLPEEDCILWCNNEQAGFKIIQRLYSCMLNQPDDKILANVAQAKELYYKYGGNKIHVYDNAFISIEQIKYLLKSYKPRLLIVDQGDKVSFAGGVKLEGHARLKELYRQFRELAKEYDTHILTVGQASSEADGKKWLTMNHMDNSKTAKPGEMDYIIGVGKTNDESEDELRYLSLSKNKLTGKHTKYTVKFNHLTGRYEDL